jgi:alpha-glucuronidase
LVGGRRGRGEREALPKKKTQQIDLHVEGHKFLMVLHRLSLLSILLISAVALNSADKQHWDQAWLQYSPIEGSTAKLTFVCKDDCQDNSITNAAVAELRRGIAGLMGTNLTSVPVYDSCSSPPGSGNGVALRCTGIATEHARPSQADEGFRLSTSSCGSLICVSISPASSTGSASALLYGAFSLLRTVARNQSIAHLDIVDTPKTELRMWDLWDNYRGSIERGYFGPSVFEWGDLPGVVSPRYQDYARLLASVGINRIAFLNVNACGDGNDQLLNATVLAELQPVAAIFAAYAVRLFITPCYASPIKVGGLKTADPLNAGVIAWWKNTVAKIHTSIPSFEGFLIKADSEGDPGPRTYGRNQSQGANMLGDALEQINGTVIWRAFEYGGNGDRATNALATFAAYDGEFHQNVILQVSIVCTL